MDETFKDCTKCYLGESVQEYTHKNGLFSYGDNYIAGIHEICETCRPGSVKTYINWCMFFEKLEDIADQQGPDVALGVYERWIDEHSDKLDDEDKPSLMEKLRKSLEIKYGD